VFSTVIPEVPNKKEAEALLRQRRVPNGIPNIAALQLALNKYENNIDADVLVEEVAGRVFNLPRSLKYRELVNWAEAFKDDGGSARATRLKELDPYLTSEFGE
jgi:hypothetical protein